MASTNMQPPPPPSKPAAPRYGNTLLPMQYLQAPGMRGGLRSPSRESIASDFSVMSVASGVDGAHRRKRLAHFSKSRETINTNFERMSLNMSVDVPVMRHTDQDFLIPGQNAFVKPHQITRCFSFSDIRTSAFPEQDEALREGPAAVSDPSLSVNSDFDDEISMFFDDKGEPINFNDRSGAAERISAVVSYPDDVSNVLLPDDVTAANLPVNKRSKLRQRIKRKFLNFSFNELIRRRRSKKSSTADSDRSSTGSASPRPEKRVHVFPQSSHSTLTDCDIEREQGKALSKYSRNLMIFNWLHNTEESWFTSQMQ